MTRSLRLPHGTPLEHVIAAFNGLADRVDAIEQSTDSHVSRCGACDGTCAHGSDCHVPKALEASPFASAWTLTRNGDRLVLTEGREVMEYALPPSISGDEMRERLLGFVGTLHRGGEPYTYAKATRRELVLIIPVLGYQDMKGCCLWWVSPEIHQKLNMGGLVERADDQGRVMRVEAIGNDQRLQEEECIRVAPARER